MKQQREDTGARRRRRRRRKSHMVLRAVAMDAGDVRFPGCCDRLAATMRCERRPPHPMPSPTSGNRAVATTRGAAALRRLPFFTMVTTSCFAVEGVMMLMVWAVTQVPRDCVVAVAGAADDECVSRRPPLAPHAAIGGRGGELRNVEQVTAPCFMLASCVAEAGDATIHPIVAVPVAAGRASCVQLSYNGVARALSQRSGAEALLYF